MYPQPCRLNWTMDQKETPFILLWFWFSTQTGDQKWSHRCIFANWDGGNGQETSQDRYSWVNGVFNPTQRSPQWWVGWQLSRQIGCMKKMECHNRWAAESFNRSSRINAGEAYSYSDRNTSDWENHPKWTSCRRLISTHRENSLVLGLMLLLPPRRNPHKDVPNIWPTSICCICHISCPHVILFSLSYNCRTSKIETYV